MAFFSSLVPFNSLSVLFSPRLRIIAKTREANRTLKTILFYALSIWRLDETQAAI